MATINNTTNTVARVQEKGTFTLTATYEAAAVPDGDVVQMVKIASGVTVVGGHVVFDALGGSTSIKAGDGDDDDYYLASVSSSSAAFKPFQAATFFPKQYTADDTVDVIVTGATGTGTITLVLQCTAEPVDLT